MLLGSVVGSPPPRKVREGEAAAEDEKPLVPVPWGAMATGANATPLGKLGLPLPRFLGPKAASSRACSCSGHRRRWIAGGPDGGLLLSGAATTPSLEPATAPAPARPLFQRVSPPRQDQQPGPGGDGGGESDR